MQCNCTAIGLFSVLQKTEKTPNVLLNNFNMLIYTLFEF